MMILVTRGRCVHGGAASALLHAQRREWRRAIGSCFAAQLARTYAWAAQWFCQFRVLRSAVILCTTCAPPGPPLFPAGDWSAVTCRLPPEGGTASAQGGVFPSGYRYGTVRHSTADELLYDGGKLWLG